VWERGAGGDGPPLSLAWWPFVALIAGWIWNGIQVAAKITLEVVAYSVKVLWAFATTTFNALRALGKGVIIGLQKSWSFLRGLYEHVLRPAWQKFWQFVQWALRTLERLFEPVVKLVKFLRKWVLDFYDKWVRPILDIIGVARRCCACCNRSGSTGRKRSIGSSPNSRRGSTPPSATSSAY
jgi:hypothetical protein